MQIVVVDRHRGYGTYCGGLSFSMITCVQCGVYRCTVCTQLPELPGWQCSVISGEN